MPMRSRRRVLRSHSQLEVLELTGYCRPGAAKRPRLARSVAGGFLLCAGCSGDRVWGDIKKSSIDPQVLSADKAFASPNEGSAYSHIAPRAAADSSYIAFVDGRRVLTFARNGTQLASAERIGDGPGEWKYVTWVGADSGGVALVDVATFRLIRLRSDLSRASDQSIPPIVRGGAVVGRLGAGAFVSLLDPPRIPGVGLQRFATTLIRWEAGSTRVDTISALAGTDVFIDPAEQMFVRVPGGRVDWAAARDSIIVAGNGSDDSVMVVVADSKAAWIRLRGLPMGERLNATATAAFVEEQVFQLPDPDDRRRMRRTFTKVQVPSMGPRFQGMLLDDRARIWLGTTTKESARGWRRFSVRGDSIPGVVWLPSDAKPRWVERGDIWATQPDSEGAQRVVRFRLPAALR
jgi:hypothetical protein